MHIHLIVSFAADMHSEVTQLRDFNFYCRPYWFFKYSYFY